MSNNNLELIERINEALETAGALGSVYSSVAWSYAGSFLNATLALYSETDPDRVQRLEARIEELAAIAGWASSLALPDYRPTVDQLIDRVGKTETVIDEDGLLEAKAELTGLDINTLRAALQVSEVEQAERARLQKAMLEQHEARIRQEVARALAAPMDASFELSDKDAQRITERLAEKAQAAKDRALMQVVRARKMPQITRAVAEIKLLEGVLPLTNNLAQRFALQVESSSQRAPVEQASAELLGTDERGFQAHVPRRVNA